MIFSYNNDEEVLNDKSMQWRQHNKTTLDLCPLISIIWIHLQSEPHTKTRSFYSLLLDFLELKPLSSLLSTGI